MPPHIFKKSILNLDRWSINTELLVSLLDEPVTDENCSIARGPLPFYLYIFTLCAIVYFPFPCSVSALAFLSNVVQHGKQV